MPLDSKFGIQRQVISEPRQIGPRKVDAHHPPRAPSQETQAKGPGVREEIEPIPPGPGEPGQAGSIRALIEEEPDAGSRPARILQPQVHPKAKPALMNTESTPSVHRLVQPSLIRGRAPTNPWVAGPTRARFLENLDNFARTPRPIRPVLDGGHHRIDQRRARSAAHQHPKHGPQAVHIQARQAVGLAVNQPQGIGVRAAIGEAPRRTAASQAAAMAQRAPHPGDHLRRVIEHLGSGTRPHPRGDRTGALHPGGPQGGAPGPHNLDPSARLPRRGIVARIVGQNPWMALAQHPGGGPRDVKHACLRNRHRASIPEPPKSHRARRKCCGLG